jgi:hypothetical protein
MSEPTAKDLGLPKGSHMLETVTLPTGQRVPLCRIGRDTWRTADGRAIITWDWEAGAWIAAAVTGQHHLRADAVVEALKQAK